MINVALFGANGKMGREVIKALSRERDLSLIATIGRLFASNDEIKFYGDSDHKVKIQWIKPIVHQSVNDIDVVIDFSEPNASLNCLRFCTENSIRFVSGTTGFNEEHHRGNYFFIEKNAYFSFLEFLPRRSNDVHSFGIYIK